MIEKIAVGMALLAIKQNEAAAEPRDTTRWPGTMARNHLERDDGRGLIGVDFFSTPSLLLGW